MDYVQANLVSSTSFWTKKSQVQPALVLICILVLLHWWLGLRLRSNFLTARGCRNRRRPRSTFFSQLASSVAVPASPSRTLARHKSDSSDDSRSPSSLATTALPGSPRSDASDGVAAVARRLMSKNVDSMEVEPQSDNGEVSKAQDSELSSSTSTGVAAVLLLIVVKCATDVITSLVERPPPAAMALASELTAFPISFAFLLSVNAMNAVRENLSDGKQKLGRHSLKAIVKEALTDRPLSLMPLGFIWALDQLLYFYALSNLGPVSYTVLAQTKIFFTVAFLRRRGLVDQLTTLQIASFCMLFSGTTVVALGEAPSGVAATGGNKLLGMLAVICGHICTCWANVKFEARLKEPFGNIWARNLQVLFAITAALLVTASCQVVATTLSNGSVPSISRLVLSFASPMVWVVVVLKALSVVFLAMTLRAGGNILFAISKPWPVVLATIATCALRGHLPPLSFLGGVAMSTAGIVIYYGSKMKK